MNIQEERQAIEINMYEFKKGYANKLLPISRINQYVEAHGLDEFINEIVEDYELIRRKNENA